MKIVLFIALLVCFAASEAGKRVVGGSPATATQASFTVSRVSDSGLSPQKEGYFCSGSIIGSNYVLTAASCLRDIYTTGGRNYDVNRNRVVVIVNHPNLTQNAPNSKQFDVDTIYYNTYSFISGPVADVAIIRTNDNMLQGGTGATRVYLADSNTASYGLEDPGYSATVSGWGIKTPDTSTGEYADYLTSSDVTLIDTTTCQSASPGFAISNNYICAGGIYRGSCIGDEGAPLVVDVTIGGTTYYLQVGIAALQSSITQPRCDGSYGVYSRVSQFKGWAENFAGNLPDIPTPSTTGVNSGIATTGLTGTTLQSGNTTSSPNNAQMMTISAFLVVFMAFFI